MSSRKQLSKVANIFSMNSLISLTNQRVFLPFYHTVANEQLPHISHLYPLRNIKLFEQDLDFFLTCFSPITMDKLATLVEQENSTKPVFHLSFDDGLSEIYSVIAPLLEQRGILATFFVNTDFVDNKNLFYRYKISLIIDAIKKNPTYISTVREQLKCPNNVESALLRLTFHDTVLIDEIAKSIDVNFTKFLAENQPYLTSAQIEDLIKRGFTIGSHAANHPLFSGISFEEQQRQVLESFDFLSRNFGIKSRFFAFPFTDDNVSAKFITWSHQNQNCKLTFGTAGLKHDFTKYHLQRTPIEGNLESAERIVKTEYLYFALKSLIGRNHLNRI